MRDEKNESYIFDAAVEIQDIFEFEVPDLEGSMSDRDPLEKREGYVEPTPAGTTIR